MHMKAADWMVGWRQDLVFSARALRREPFLAVVIIATLALGIGANATIFGIVDQLLLRGPAHVAAPHQVMRVYLTAPGPDGSPSTSGTTGYVVSTILQGTEQFDDVAVYSHGSSSRVGYGEHAVEIRAGWSTGSMFTLLGVSPALGRFYTAEETQPGQIERLAVLEYSYWQAMYGGRDDVLGQHIVVDDKEYTIVGVAPRGFTGPDFSPVRVWLAGASSFEPTPDWPHTWNASWVRVLVRLKPDVSLERAEAAATTAYRAAAEEANARRAVEASVSLLPPTYTNAGVEPPEIAVARWLVGVTLVVLLIACANVVNLLIARGIRRQRELAVRLALGVTRARLVRLLMSESLLLAAAGGLLALVVVVAGSQFLRNVLLPDVLWDAPLNYRVIAFGSAIVLLTGVLVGLLPAVQAVQQEVTDTLKATSRGGGTHRRLLGTLTVVQTAFALVLLVGAALFVNSLYSVRSLDLGIEPDRVLVAWPTFTDTPGSPGTDASAERARRADFYRDVIDRLRTRPDVINASIAVSTPMRSTMSGTLRVQGWDSIPRLPGGGPYRIGVAGGYFETVGTRILRGRGIDDADTRHGDNIAVINDVMAHTLWPGEDALGKCLYIGGSAEEPAPCSQVIGIAQETRRFQLVEDPAMQYYVPLRASAAANGMLLVRTAGRPESLIPELRSTLHGMDATISHVSMSRLGSTLDPHIRPWRLGTTMFLVFGGLALLIAAIGLYSVIAYGVTQRRAELGVRVALGAGNGRIVRMIMRQGLGLVVLGIAIGLPLALLGASHMESMLFETSPTAPATFITVVLILLAVAVMATLIPALRAARTDPNVALRAD